VLVFLEGGGMFMKRSIIAMLAIGCLLWFIPGNAAAISLPDFDYDYDYVDSNDAGGPDYYWVNITGTGTRISAYGDDWYSGIGLGFNFPFFGYYYSGAYPSSNGLITFGSGTSQYSNYCIPSSSNPNNMIAVLWDDLWVPDSPYGIYYQHYDSCPHPDFSGRECMVIEWYNIMHLSGSDYFSFEAILFENGDILMQYGPGNPEYGSSSTTGLQYDTTAGDYLAYACNDYGSITPGLAILFVLDSSSLNPPEEELDWDEQWEVVYGLEDYYDKLPSEVSSKSEDDKFLGIECFITSAGQSGTLFPLILAALTAGSVILRKRITK